MVILNHIVKNKVVGLVLLPFALAMLLSIKGCTKTVSSSHTTTYRDTSIFVQGESVKASVSDSLLKALLDLQKAGKEPIIIYKNGKDSKTELIFSLDSLGKMQADCTTNDRYVTALIKQTKETETILQEKARESKGIILLLAISNMVLLAVLLIVVLKK